MRNDDGVERVGIGCRRIGAGEVIVVLGLCCWVVRPATFGMLWGELKGCRRPAFWGIYRVRESGGSERKREAEMEVVRR